MFKVVFGYDYDMENAPVEMSAEEVKEILAEPVEDGEYVEVYTEDGTLLWWDDLVEMGLAQD